MCAGVGTQLFAGVKWGANLDRQVNFKNFTRSFLFLLQVLTGEGWPSVLAKDISSMNVHATLADAAMAKFVWSSNGQISLHDQRTDLILSYIM